MTIETLIETYTLAVRNTENANCDSYISVEEWEGLKLIEAELKDMLLEYVKDM